MLVDVGEHVRVARRLEELVGHLGVGPRRLLAVDPGREDHRGDGEAATVAARPVDLAAGDVGVVGEGVGAGRRILDGGAAGALPLAQQRERGRRLGREQPDDPVQARPGGEVVALRRRGEEQVARPDGAHGERHHQEPLAASVLEQAHVHAEGRGAIERRARGGAGELAGALSGGQVDGGARGARGLEDDGDELLRRGRPAGAAGERGGAGHPPGGAGVRERGAIELPAHGPVGELELDRADGAEDLVAADGHHDEAGAAQRDGVGGGLEREAGGERVDRDVGDHGLEVVDQRQARPLAHADLDEGHVGRALLGEREALRQIVRDEQAVAHHLGQQVTRRRVGEDGEDGDARPAPAAGRGGRVSAHRSPPRRRTPAGPGHACARRACPRRP